MPTYTDSAASRTRLDLLLPLIVLVVAATLRIVYLAEISGTPEFRHPLYDPEYNAYWARGLVTGDWALPPGVNDPEIRTTPHGRPPGYPWFLATIYALFGVNDYGPRIAQMCIGVLNALLLYWLGKRLFGRGMGFVCGLCMATYWVFPYFEGILTYPSVVVLLLLLFLHALTRWRMDGRLLWMLAAGALLGGLALFRPNVLLLLPALAAWLALLRLQRQLPIPSALCVLVVLVAGVVATLAPAFVRNHVVARDFVFISAYGGINLYVGNHPDASLVEPHIPELLELAGIEHWSCFDYPAIVRGLAAREGRESMRFSEASRYFYRRAFAFIIGEPRLFLVNMLRKAALFFGPREITNDTVMEYDKAYSPILRWLPGFPWALALFLLGSLFMLVDLVRGRVAIRALQGQMILLLWLVFAAYFVSVILFFVAGRYRVPVMPIMLFFGSYGMVRILEHVRRKQWGVTIAALALFLCLLLPAHVNVTGYAPSEGTFHLRRAMAWTAAGKDEQARSEYMLALEHGAESSIIHANLGRLHIDNGEIAPGLEMYERGLEQNPNNTIILNNLGYERYKLGEVGEAIDLFERAVTLNPRFALARINLGNALVDAGQFMPALNHFQEAQRLNPADPAAAYNAGRVLFALGRMDESADYYERALAVQPSFVEALNNLGYLYALQGEHERALSYYNRAVAARSEYTLAWNNAGNSLTALGRNEEAAAAYAQVLEHNPDDPFALYNLGMASLASGQAEQARQYFERAVDADDSFAAPWLQLGAVRLEQGETESAIECLQRALELAPGNEEARLLLDAAMTADEARETPPSVMP